MAEAVRQQLENQLDELEDLRRRGLFSLDEIRHIVKRRKAFEYALRRRQPQKVDFLRYIQYELSLEELRKKRKKARNLTRTNNASEFAIVRRLHFTFHRALLKFKGDVRLWNQYFDFCEQSGAAKVTSKAFGTALQYHPNEAGIWVKAAKWEFEHNANIKAARILMQRGLRINPKSADLWREYLRLELLFLEKVVLRREILGLSTAAEDVAERTEEEQRESEKVAQAQEREANSINRSTNDDDDSDVDDVYNIGSDDEAAFDPTQKQAVVVPALEAEKDAAPLLGDRFLKGDIPLLILRAAQEEFASDVATQLTFLPVVRLFRGTKHIRDEIYKSLPDSEQAAEAIARRPVEDIAADSVMMDENDYAAALQQSIHLFEQACKTASMHERFCTFLLEQLQATPSSNTAQAALLVTALLAACDRAVTAGLATPGIYKAWCEASVALGRGSVADALARAEQGARATKSVEAWTYCLRLHVLAGESDVDAFGKLVEASLASCTHLDVAPLHTVWLDFLTVHGSAKQITKAFNAAVEALHGPRSEPFCVRYVLWANISGGVVKAREAYTRLLDKLGLSFLSLYRTCLDLEMAQPAVDQTVVRRLYERALASHGQHSTELWLACMQTERSWRCFDRLSALHWRAVKQLADPAEFIERASHMQ
eukprot:m.214506 g.214506  ORF g.214506 m.214506 type:complete len:656 (+) comp34964_c0_seq1:152-2119(+)